MSQPFTATRVLRFLLLCLLGMLAVVAIFQLLLHIRPHQAITPSTSAPQSSRNYVLPPPAGASPSGVVRYI